MKKLNKHLLISFLFLSIASFAQKIKIKKGVVLIDKVESALIKEEGRNDYTYSDLNTKKPVFRSKLVTEKISEELIKQWIEVSSPDGSIKTEIPYEMLTFSLSMKKVFTLLFLKKYKLIQKGSIDHNAVKSFFEEERPLISQEVKQLVAGEIKKATQEKIKLEAKKEELGKINFKIDYINKYIYSGEIPYDFHEEKPNLELVYPNMIGSYTSQKSVGSAYSGTILTFYDLDQNKIAIVKPGGYNEKEVNLVQQSKKFTYKADFNSDFSDYNVGQQVKEAVEQLYLNDIYLRNQYRDNKLVAKDLAKEKLNKEIDKFKYNTINFYDVKGYFIDENNQKVDGLITIWFENVKNNFGSDITHYDASFLGKVVKIKTKENNLTLKASGKKVSFCINEEGKSEKCFKSIATKFLGLNYQFVLVLDENDSNISFYKDYDSGIVYLKKTNKPHAIMLSKRNVKSNSKSISKYLECPEMREKLMTLDYSNLNELYKIKELYNNLCKK
ncbi:hypothetical protein [Tenacibaculum geojense]|uniref:Uncharacterized protein n=1 Tax=Tenacibaculum geojense TaxID=915352 RepID=A0ABW3JQF7_9FLAO